MDNLLFTNRLGGGYYGSININILRMEKEPKPFSEDKAQEIMEAEGLEERSQEAQEALEAGRSRGVDAAMKAAESTLKSAHGSESKDLLFSKIQVEYDIREHEKELKNIAVSCDLSKEAMNLLRRHRSGVSYSPNHTLVVSKNVDQDILFEIVEKIPDIRCFQSYLGAGKLRAVISKIHERFPSAEIYIHDEEK